MKIFCIGRNYAEHATELGNEIPSDPVIFMKPKNALLGSRAPFYYPAFSNELNYEAEIVLGVSKNGKYISKKHAYKYINQVTLGIDFTARDVQNELKSKGLPWEKAKAWDNSAIVGKWIPATEDTFKSNINFSLEQNEQTVQVGNSSEMIFPFDYLIAHISEYFSLNIGDLIFTGTPAGTGECSVGDVLKGYLNNDKMFEVEIK